MTDEAALALLETLVGAVQELSATAREVVSELVKIEEAIRDVAPAAGRDDRPTRGTLR